MIKGKVLRDYLIEMERKGSEKDFDFYFFSFFCFENRSIASFFKILSNDKSITEPVWLS